LWLIGRGLRAQFAGRVDRQRIYDGFAGGAIPESAIGKWNGNVSEWTMALMAALAEEISRGEPGLSAEEVRIKAEKMTFDMKNADRIRLRKHPDVLRYLHELKRKDGSESLLGLARGYAGGKVNV
jgi:hypothetical protein